MKSKIIIFNLTPHEITVVGYDPILPSMHIARVSTSEIQTSILLNGIPTGIQEIGEVTGLPPETTDTVYIVSTMVRLTCPDRLDLYSPGQLVRDDNGKPIGCQMLIRNGEKYI